TNAMMRDSRSDPGLVVPDWDRNHGDTLSEGFESRVESRMRDTQRRPLQQLDLRRRPHDDHIRWDRAELVDSEILPHGEHNLSPRKLLDRWEKRAVHMVQAVHQCSQRRVDERCAGQLPPWKGDRLSSRVVVKRTGIVELRRPGGARKIEL